MLILAAGFYQEGKLDDLKDGDIYMMLNVGLAGPTFVIKMILEQQKKLDNLVVITSSSQFTPRLMEPVYTAVKAGIAMLANSLSLDGRIGKTLVAAPAGMATPFWKGTDKDTKSMLDPDWVAEQILEQLKGDYKYRFIKLLRFSSGSGGFVPVPKLEVVETRVPAKP